MHDGVQIIYIYLLSDQREGMENRKEDIIMEIGAEWIRVGLVSDKVPRKSFSASILYTFKSGLPIKDY